MQAPSQEKINWNIRMITKRRSRLELFLFQFEKILEVMEGAGVGLILINYLYYLQY